jgi:cytidylate kinase
VILGRGADEILRKAGVDSLNVFIHASELHRAVRLQAKTGITDATELQKLMTKHDNNRRTYYTHYTGKEWGDLKNYHLTLDSGILGEDLCVKMIIEAANV